MADAEGAVHGIPPGEVHFHEVGALDALADVVGVSAALHELDVTDAVASAIAVGSGISRGAHGLIPVPAPATLRLLADAGAPVCGGPAPHEACTPTGAALLVTTCSSFGELPAVRMAAVGVGAGDRDHGPMPNVLRVVLG